MMAKRHGLRALEMCEAGHNGICIVFGPRDNGQLQCPQPACHCVHRVTDPELEVRCNLIVAGTRRMKAPGDGPNFFGEAGFRHHMDIFKRQIFRHAISRIVQCDGIESIDDKDAATCDLHKLRIAPLDAPALNRMHRFARLLRKLGWTMRELDYAIPVFDIDAWLADGGRPLHPSEGITEPLADKPGAYTWNKAPRLAGQVLETGALARQLAQGQPLLRALWQRSRGNVFTRVLARAMELAQLVLLAQDCLRAIVPGAPCCEEAHLPEAADAVGLCEAARGSLGHWLSIRGGRIASYQIVAPTGWNFSPRDAAGTPGPLEQALVGTPVGEGNVAVQHVVRSFDPCMVCTVH